MKVSADASAFDALAAHQGFEASFLADGVLAAGASLTGSPFERTSAMPDRARRILTFGAISSSTSVSSVDLVILPISPPLVTTTSPRRAALHHIALLLGPPLLRAQDQEIHDRENGDEGRELNQHVGRPEGGRAAGLGEGWRNEQGRWLRRRAEKGRRTRGDQRRGIYNGRRRESNAAGQAERKLTRAPHPASPPQTRSVCRA